MNVALRKVSAVVNQALPRCWMPPFSQEPVLGGGVSLVRQYRSMPTHEIGRWKYLLPRRSKKKMKKKRKENVRPIPRDAYVTMNVSVSGYDMTLVESYAKYIHNFSQQLGFRVSGSYAMPTKSTEVLLMPEDDIKFYADSVLKTHERIVQLNKPKSLLIPIYMEMCLKNQPEGVQLTMREHTEDEYRLRLKSRLDMEALMAQIKK
ncbi:large ribosomal subunit protein mL48 [Aulostomus maculatus]